MKLAIVGASGLVGSVMLEVLQEFNLPYTELLLVASEKSVGKTIAYKNEKHTIISMEDAIARKPDIAIFSAGGSTSLKYAPMFAAVGTTVIDNSSAWRMDDSKKLIVPEVNGANLTKEDLIIANPNCSTIQLVVALQPLHQLYDIKRLVISTYQSVTGTGVKGVTQLQNERAGNYDGPMAYYHPIDLNCIPHGGDFSVDDYTTEEIKLEKETHKILNAPQIKVTATVVRVPVYGGHSESVNIEFNKSIDIAAIKNILKNAPGIQLLDDINNNVYPMPIHSKGKNDVMVGRVRIDRSAPNAINMWVVSDNLRKGAATNAIQIAAIVMKLKGL